MTPSPTAWRSLLWRVGVGAPPLDRVRKFVELVAKDLDDPRVSAEAAWELGLSGLYRTPAVWGSKRAWEWALRCQAASFEIAIALGGKARPFVEEHAFGPIRLLHGVAIRALLRLHATGAIGGALQKVWRRLLEVDEHARAVALDAVRVSPPKPKVKRRFEEGLERLVEQFGGARCKMAAIEALSRLAPERARRFLPFLKQHVDNQEGLAMEASLLVLALDPRNHEARATLQRFAEDHPDQSVRDRLEATLKPPVFVDSLTPVSGLPS